jgi:hypothetical protein
MDYPATNEKHSRRVAERTRLHEPLGMPAAFLSPSLERVCGVPFEPLGSQGTSPEGEPTAAPRGRMTTRAALLAFQLQSLLSALTKATPPCTGR